MTTKEKFGTYYLPWLIGIGILFGFQFVLALFDDEQRQRVMNVPIVLLFMALIIGTAFLCGGMYHYFFAVYRPKRAIKLFNKLKSLGLQELGLAVDKSNKTFSGYYQGYFLTVSTDSLPDDGEWIRTRAFIVSKEEQEEAYKRLQKKFTLDTDGELVWFTCKTKMRFGRTPKKKRLQLDIDKFTDALRYEQVEPLLVDDNDHSQPST